MRLKMIYGKGNSIILALHGIIFLFCNVGESCVFEDRRVVHTYLGNIKGEIIIFDGTFVREFTRIPYAEPPLGERRYKKATPVRPWYGTWQATTLPPACVQYSEDPYPWYHNDTLTSEDCLYLNVWTPISACPNNTKPVLLWIHGGNYVYGSIRDFIYGGQALCAMGDILVVTINYRLGAFGFLYSGSSDAPGNVGISDMLLAMKWVKNHIASFGGDPDQITLAGESVGSMATSVMVVSPLARGLFSRVIMQSGSSATHLPNAANTNLQCSQQLAKYVGCSSDEFSMEKYPMEVVDCMRRVDARILAKAQFHAMSTHFLCYKPQIGDQLIPYDPRVAFIAGNFQNSDILIGNCKDEGCFQVTKNNRELFGFLGEKDPQINKTVGREILRQAFKKVEPDHYEAIMNYYLGPTVGEYDSPQIKRQLCDAYGDILLMCPTVYTAEKFADNGNSVYFYLWTHRPSRTPWAPWMGVSHFSEVAFVFGTPLKQPYLYKELEVSLSAKMIQIWTDFVKNGAPSRNWPLYSKRNPEYRTLEVGDGRVEEGPHKKNCDFLRPFFGF